MKNFSPSECHLSHFFGFPTEKGAKEEMEKKLNFTLLFLALFIYYESIKYSRRAAKSDGEGFPKCQVLNPNQLTARAIYNVSFSLFSFLL